jgi:predicted DNA binding protein
LKLLEAMILAKGHQKWIETVTSRYHVRLRLLYAKPSRGREEMLQIFEMEIDPKMKDRIVRYLQNNSEISELEITNSSKGRLLGLIRAKGVIMRLIADSDCFLVRASGEDGSPIRWELLGTRRSLQRLLIRLRRRGIGYSVAGSSEVKRQTALTPRQEWFLRSALESGYFDSPKKVRIRALAASLGVSAPTLHESLRKSQRSLIVEHVGVKMPSPEARLRSGRGATVADPAEGPFTETTSK